MTTGIAFASAELTYPDGTTVEDVGLATRNGTLTVRDQAGHVLDRIEGITDVSQTSRKRWQVQRGPDTFTIFRRNCGCS